MNDRPIGVRRHNCCNLGYILLVFLINYNSYVGSTIQLYNEYCNVIKREGSLHTVEEEKGQKSYS